MEPRVILNVTTNLHMFTYSMYHPHSVFFVQPYIEVEHVSLSSVMSEKIELTTDLCQHTRSKSLKMLEVYEYVCTHVFRFDSILRMFSNNAVTSKVNTY